MNKTTEYEKFEAECDKIRKANEVLLAAFETWLQLSGLAEKTVRHHRSNIDFYINEYLLYEDPIEAADGVSEIGGFLGDWFIRKTTWSSDSSIRANAASMKKFYTFLAEGGRIAQEDLQGLKDTIKREMPEWLAALQRYDDLANEDMDEEWGFR